MSSFSRLESSQQKPNGYGKIDAFFDVSTESYSEKVR